MAGTAPPDGPAFSLPATARGSAWWLRRLLAVLSVSLLVGACTAVKLGYENLPFVVEWQADRYLSLDDEQEAIVSKHAKAIQRWHRKSLLPVYADFLRGVEAELAGPVSPRQVAVWRQAAVDSWRPLAEQAAPAVAEVAVTLRPEQLAHLKKALARSNDKSAAEYRPADPAKREEGRYKRLVERAESFFGSTNAAQKELMRSSAAAMARNEDAWWQSRLARQKAVVDLLTELSAEKPPLDDATRRSRRVLDGLFSLHDPARAGNGTDAGASPEPAAVRELRARIEMASAAGDDLTAGLLALATPEQRQNAVKRLGGYRKDFDVLAAR